MHERSARTRENRAVSLFRFAPSRGPRWQLGVQAAIGMSVPIAVMTLLGHPTLGFIAGSGAFTVLFAGAAPVVERARRATICSRSDQRSMALALHRRGCY